MGNPATNTNGKIFRSRETANGMRTDIAYAEKRGAARRPLQVNARLEHENGGRLHARTLDISSTGVCLLVDQSLPFNEPWNISFEMFLDGSAHPVQMLAEVQHLIVAAEGVRIGFQFKRMSMASMITISRFVGDGASAD